MAELETPLPSGCALGWWDQDYRPTTRHRLPRAYLPTFDHESPDFACPKPDDVYSASDLFSKCRLNEWVILWMGKGMVFDRKFPHGLKAIQFWLLKHFPLAIVKKTIDHQTVFIHTMVKHLPLKYNIISRQILEIIVNFDLILNKLYFYHWINLKIHYFESH